MWVIKADEAGVKKSIMMVVFVFLTLIDYFFPATAFRPSWPGQQTAHVANSIQHCTGPFNWGEAHCAGEKVKQTSRTINKEVS